MYYILLLSLLCGCMYAADTDGSGGLQKPEVTLEQRVVYARQYHAYVREAQEKKRQAQEKDWAGFSVGMGSWHLQTMSAELQRAQQLGCLPDGDMLQHMLTQTDALSATLKQMATASTSASASADKAEGKSGGTEGKEKISLPEHRRKSHDQLTIMKYLLGTTDATIKAYHSDGQKHRTDMYNQDLRGAVRNGAMQIACAKNFGPMRSDSCSDEDEAKARFYSGYGSDSD